MADAIEVKKEVTGDAADADAQNTSTGDGGADQDDQRKNKLEDASVPELLAHIKELRTEQMRRREENAILTQTLEGVPALEKALKELQDKDKSEDEKRTERMAELEEAAGKLPELERYQKHVRTAFAERMKAVKEMGEEVQTSVNSLLEDVPKDDFLGRMKVVDAVSYTHLTLPTTPYV